MAFQITDSQRGNPSLLYGGFSFFLYFKSANKTTWSSFYYSSSARVITDIANAAVLEIKFDHSHDGLSEQQEARQIFAGRCKRRAREFGRASNYNHQARADQHTEFQRRPQLSGPALSTSAILHQQRRKALPALPKNRSQVNNDKYDIFQLDVLYLCIMYQCMMSLLK